MNQFNQLKQLRQSLQDESNAIEELKPLLPNFTNVLTSMWIESSLSVVGPAMNWSDYNSVCRAITDKLKQVNEYPILVNCINKILIHLLNTIAYTSKYGYFDRILQAKTFEQYLNIVNNVRNDFTEALDKPNLPPMTIKDIKDFFGETLMGQLTLMEKSFEFLLGKINGSKDDAIKVLAHKLKIYLYPYIESYFDKIQELDETSGLDLQTIQLIKSFDKYEYLKLNDLAALGLILYDQHEKINLHMLGSSQPPKYYINLSDSDSEPE